MLEHWGVSFLGYSSSEDRPLVTSQHEMTNADSSTAAFVLLSVKAKYTLARTRVP